MISLKDIKFGKGDDAPETKISEEDKAMATAAAISDATSKDNPEKPPEPVTGGSPSVAAPVSGEEKKPWEDLFKSDEDLWKAYDELSKKAPEEKIVEKVVEKPLEIEDSFAKEVLAVAKAGGDVMEYVRKKTADHKSLTTEDLLRKKLREEYPSTSPEKLEVLYKRELADKYGYDPDDSDETSVARILMDAEAEKYRAKLLKEQAELTAPKPADDALAGATQGATSEAAKPVKAEGPSAEEQWIDFVDSDPVLKKYREEKVITLKQGDTPIKYEVGDNMERVVEIVKGGDENFWSLFKGEKEGEINWDKLVQTVAFALDPDGYNQSVFTAGGNTGTGKVLDVLENPAKKGPPPSVTGSEPKTLAEAMLAAVKKK